MGQGFTKEEMELFDKLIIESMKNVTDIINGGKVENGDHLSKNFANVTVRMAKQIIYSRRNVLSKVASELPGLLKSGAVAPPVYHDHEEEKEKK